MNVYLKLRILLRFCTAVTLIIPQLSTHSIPNASNQIKKNDAQFSVVVIEFLCIFTESNLVWTLSSMLKNLYLQVPLSQGVTTAIDVPDPLTFKVDYLKLILCFSSLL